MKQLSPGDVVRESLTSVAARLFLAASDTKLVPSVFVVPRVEIVRVHESDDSVQLSSHARIA